MLEQGGTRKVELTDGAQTADVIDLGTYAGVGTYILDGSGDPITSFGGGTQYTEGAVDATPTGTVAMWKDVGNVISSVSAATPLPVNIVAGAGSGGTASPDDSVFTPGVTNFTPAGGFYDVGRTAAGNGDAAAFAMTQKRALYTTLETPAGDSAMDETNDAIRANIVVSVPIDVTDGGGSLTVDGTVAATQSGTWATQITDGSLTATVRNTGTSDSLNVAIVDGSGNQITTFGGGTQYTEGDVDASPTGTVGMFLDSGNTINAVSAANPLPVDPGTVTVTATNLDIRDLTSASDSVAAVQSGTWNIGSVTTLPAITGSVTANAGTNLNTSALALESGGNLATLAGAVTASVVQANTKQINGVAPSMGNGVSGTGVQRVTIASDSTGNLGADLRVAGAAVSTSNPVAIQPPASGYLTTNIGNVNGAAVNVGTGAASTGTLRVAVSTDSIVAAVPTASASATGLSISKTDALVATAVAVKAAAGRVYGYHIYNSNTTDAYVQFYDIAQGSVTVGSSARTETLWIPAGGAIDSEFTVPLSFATAITIAATTTITGSSAPSTGLLTNIFYL